MAALPEPIRLEIFAELARHFDAVRWEEVSAPAATEMYDRFAKDPKIGGDSLGSCPRRRYARGSRTDRRSSIAGRSKASGLWPR